MKRISKQLLTALILVTLLYNHTDITAYDLVSGVEQDDVLDIAFTKHLDGQFALEYTPANPLRVIVDDSIIDPNLVDELLGMKIGEEKLYTSWITEFPASLFVEIFGLTVLMAIEDCPRITCPTTTAETSFWGYIVVLTLISLTFISRIKKLRRKSL